jgi:hypothetical protein
MKRRSAFLFAAVLLSVSCGSETAPDEHSPASARLFAAGQEITPNLVLARGQTVRIEVRFYDGGGELMTGLEAEHFAALTFSPASLAGIAPVSGLRFFFDVTPQNVAGTGQVRVGFGHDAAADELSFGPFPVTVP